LLKALVIFSVNYELK